jgi:gliding motility-associated-like protein
MVEFDRIFPPNAFSPNAPEPKDRVFLINAEGIISQGYRFMILSRWDDIVFEVKDEIKGWDGKMKNGSFAPAGSYLWILQYADTLGFKHQQKGAVTLVY